MISINYFAVMESGTIMQIFSLYSVAVINSMNRLYRNIPELMNGDYFISSKSI